MDQRRSRRSPARRRPRHAKQSFAPEGAPKCNLGARTKSKRIKANQGCLGWDFDRRREPRMGANTEAIKVDQGGSRSGRLEPSRGSVANQSGDKSPHSKTRVVRGSFCSWRPAVVTEGIRVNPGESDLSSRCVCPCHVFWIAGRGCGRRSIRGRCRSLVTKETFASNHGLRIGNWSLSRRYVAVFVPL